MPSEEKGEREKHLINETLSQSNDDHRRRCLMEKLELANCKLSENYFFYLYIKIRIFVTY